VASELPGVVAVVPYVEARRHAGARRAHRGTVIRGIEPGEEKRAVGLASHIQGGRIEDLQPGSFRIVLGDALAEALGVAIGEDVILIAPEGSATPAGIAPRMRRMHVTGLFHSGMYEYDRGLALIHRDDARRIYRLGDEVSGLRLALADAFEAPRIVRELALKLGGGYFVSDWTRNHANFFRSIEMTKSMMFVILLMVVAVAAFNIVAALVMVVKEKRADIAILRTLGAGPRNILLAFTIQGMLIGLLGTVSGALLGWLISYNLAAMVRGLEQLAGTQFLDAKVYFMSDLPAYVEWGDVLQVCGVAFLLCTFATLYPAWRAALMQPAQGLRHD
jgi:lipoprotein-releasing system permease protein